MSKDQWNKQKQKLPFSRAVVGILLSTLLISGSAGLGMLYYQQIHELRMRDPKYTIRAIVQTGPATDQLDTAYLAQVLGLHAATENLYQFNAQNARQSLLANPLMTKAEIKKVFPGTILLDYTLRTPIAILGDYGNTLLDAEAIPFPQKPFFQKDVLPLFILGIREVQWGTSLKGKKFNVALQIYREYQNHAELTRIPLKKIDVSKIFARSYGQRQIVVGIGSHLLRLSTKNYRRELLNYIELLPYLHENEEIVIDLRIPKLGFVQTI